MNRKEAIFQLLDTVGDGSGTKNANGDYSTTPASFKLKHSVGRASIERMIVMIEDEGVVDSGKYGNGLTLVNGVRVYLKNASGEVIEEYTTFPIKSNGDWAGHCHDLTRHAWGGGNEIESIRWTFSKSGQPILIDFYLGEYLEVYLNDDFSGLVSHYFNVQGKYISKRDSTAE